MKLTKKIKITLLSAACIIFLMPAASFALVDVNLYGSFPFAGDWGGDDKKLTNDFGYGASAHLNTDFLIFLHVGIGGFYQFSPLTYKASGFPDLSVDSSVAGIDVYAQLDIPFIPVAPYVRLNEAIWHKIEGNGSSDTDKFNRHGVGFGVLFTIIPIPELFKLQIFGEYMYNWGEIMESKFKDHQINIGLRADIL